MKYLDKQLVWPRVEMGVDFGAERYIIFIHNKTYLVFIPGFKTWNGRGQDPIYKEAKLVFVDPDNKGYWDTKLIFTGRFTKKKLKLFENIINIYLNHPEGLDVTKLDRNKTAYL